MEMHTDKIHIATDDVKVAKQQVDKFTSKKTAMNNAEQLSENIKHAEPKSLDSVTKKNDYRIMELA